MYGGYTFQSLMRAELILDKKCETDKIHLLMHVFLSFAHIILFMNFIYSSFHPFILLSFFSMEIQIHLCDVNYMLPDSVNNSN